ncbi:unnamed protein product [Eruca vesicaria subsp. sativa]|uniref:Uncharacterized protein n=1 Tax=Eruca vesicaria subsp. sativa TaxID=29727 RepID=A0ABC8LW08_ERUVS|nr:unnamed protein product [Eruca vesicaria subsp. sativa]
MYFIEVLYMGIVVAYVKLVVQEKTRETLQWEVMEDDDVECGSESCENIKIPIYNEKENYTQFGKTKAPVSTSYSRIARGDQFVTDFKRVRLNISFPILFFLELKETIIYYSRKLNGEGLDDMSSTELASLESMLKEGFRIVEEQTDEAHEELTVKQIVEYDLLGYEWLKQKEKDDLAYQSLLAGRRTTLRNKAREFRLSPPESQPYRSNDPERLKLDIDSLKIEKERLLLLNQRMVGKELDGMGYLELYVLGFEISRAMINAEAMRKIKRAEEMEKTQTSKADDQ